MNKFHDIFLDLETDILKGKFLPGALLPSENQLVAQYGVSRETIRKALNLLIHAGYIQKMQGKGSIVLATHKFDFPISSVTSYQELVELQHIQSETRVISLEETTANQTLAQATGWALGAPVWKLVRQRNIQGEAVILDIDYLLKAIIPILPKEQAEHSIYRYFEEDLGLQISYAQKKITVEPIRAEDQKWLSLRHDTHVVVIRSVVSLEDTRCFEYTESRHRLDKFQFVDFARRR